MTEQDGISRAIERARAAHAALVTRGHPPIGEAFDAWAGSLRPAPPQPDPAAQHAAKVAAQDAARAMVRQNAAQLAASPTPIVVEGVDPPWLLLELAAATPRSAEGYQPGIVVVQADPAEFFDGCSKADLTELLAEPRVSCFIGPDAGERFRAALDGDDHRLPQAVIVLPTIRTRLTPRLFELCQQAAIRQQQRHTERSHRIAARDAATDRAHRLRRLTAPSPTEPRRVALIASRFTTVLRPMIDDLAEAFRRAGWMARLISEPNDHRRIAPAAYSEVLDAFNPDLIIAANHTRGDVNRILGGTVVPPGIPWVTWVQDAMPHLLAPDAGKHIGPLDLAVGHIGSAMIRSCGYAPERVIVAPMVTSESKFSVPSNPQADDRCHVAAFTNHSETPQTMRDRLIREAAATPQLGTVVAELTAAALQLAERPFNLFHAGSEARALVTNTLPNADPAIVENLAINVVLRLIDRVQRHRVLGWARDICRRRGWTMRIHGRGWRDHSTLADVAADELPHGEPLARAYHGAGLTLHVSSTALMHQRLIECAFAGGLPGVAATHAGVRFARSRIIKRLLTHHAELGTPGIGPQAPGMEPEPVRTFDRAASPLADRAARLCTLIGWPDEPTTAVPDVDPATCPDAEDEADLDAMIGLMELGFTDEASLEALIERANADPAWRQEHSTRIADRARATCTHASLVRRIETAYASLSSDERVSA